MPDSWIKLRDSLHDDPRVFTIASLVAKTDPGYILISKAQDLFGDVTDAVTRNALRDVTIAALSRVWAGANRHTTDGVFHKATLEYLDTLAQVRGFGQAMESVGWVIFDAQNRTMTLPNFEEHNAPNKNGERIKSKNAERQAKFRQRQAEKAAARAAAAAENPPVEHSAEAPGTAPVTSCVTLPETSQEGENNVIPSYSYSLSYSSSESGREGESREETASPPTLVPGTRPHLARLEQLKHRINRLRQAWTKAPAWTCEEEHALADNFTNLHGLEDQDWAIIAFWLRWVHSAANTSTKEPVKVTSRRGHFVAEIGAILDRATTHWKQSGAPGLNPDGTKTGTTRSKPRTEPPQIAPQDVQVSPVFAALCRDLKIPTKPTPAPAAA